MNNKKKKNREQVLYDRIHNTQSALYNYVSDMQTKAEKQKDAIKQNYYLYLAQKAADAGLELDISKGCMQDAIEAFNS